MLAAQDFTLLFQRTIDVHQATAVGADHLMRAGFLQCAGLVQHHGAGDVGHAHAEGAAEAAAFAFVIMLDALDLCAISGSDTGISEEYARQGFRRERHVFCLKHGGKLLAVLLLTISDLGLNLSNLTNCIHALIMEPDQLDPKTLFSSLHALRAHYGQDEPPVLVFPENYLEQHSIPFEKKYILWVLDTSYSDAYFDSVRNTFKRASNEQDA